MIAGSTSLVRYLSRKWLNAMLVFLPIGIAADLAHASPPVVFLLAAFAIVPLAGLIGDATEELAIRVGPGVGGLLNATFGNATELIIALFALSAGLQDVVKASISGSIIGNLLLVLGLSMFLGGLKRDRQSFDRTHAAASAGMLVLAVIGLVMPAVFDLAVFGSLDRKDPLLDSLSLMVAGVLLATYVASLVFTLRTHRSLFSAADHTEAQPQLPARAAVGLLLGATIATAVASEVLVGAIEATTRTLGVTELFVGVIIVAIVGNAAEHSTAITMAIRNKMDLAVTIAVGSSTQIALLVAPLLVIASFLIGQPMSLVFNPFEITAIGLSVLILAVVSQDGESNWFEGLQLVAVYALMAIVFFFVPAP